MVGQYDTMFDGSAVAAISEFLGQAEHVDMKLLNEIDMHVDNARTSVADRKFHVAQTRTMVAAKYTNAAVYEWNQFLSDIEDGAKGAITALSITRDTCFQIVAALATGGAAAVIEREIASTAGRFVAKAGAAAVIEGGLAVGKSSATQVSEIYLGLRPGGFELDEVVCDGLQAAVVSLSGATFAELAKPLQPFVARVTGPLTDSVARNMGDRAGALVEWAVPRAVAQLPGSVVTALVDTGIKAHRGQGFRSADEMHDAFALTLTTNIAGGLAGSLTGDLHKVASERFGGDVTRAGTYMSNEMFADHMIDAFRRSLPD
jgi:hypothetical protein